jgi:hypothetical protein
MPTYYGRKTVSVVLLSMALAGCTAPPPVALVGSVSKEAAYATYTSIGGAMDRETFGAAEANLGRYCEEVVDGFGLGGLDVKIIDASGQTVALAPLTFDAEATEHNGGYLNCVWSYSVPDFESDSKFFTVEIESVPDTQEFAREEMLAGPNLSVIDTSQR